MSNLGKTIVISHDKCASFEAEIDRLKKELEDLKDEIDKLDKANERLVKELIQALKFDNGQ